MLCNSIFNLTCVNLYENNYFIKNDTYPPKKASNLNEYKKNQYYFILDVTICYEHNL